MIYYLGCFAFSIFFAYAAEKYYIHNRKIVFIVFSALAILLPSVLAGVRALTVGYDVSMYVSPTFNSALSFNNVINYLAYNASWYKSVETLFALFAFIVSRFTDNVHWFLFFIELLIMLFTYIGWFRVRKYVPMWLGLCMYLFLYYNQSLNLMRQSIAAALVFFALSYILNRSWIKYYIVVIIAIFFHSSAIIALAFYPIFVFCTGTKRKENPSYLRALALCVGIVVVLLLLEPIVNALVSVGILPSRFLKYVSGDESGSEFSLGLIILAALQFVMMILPHKQLMKRDNNTLSYLSLGFLNFVSTFLKIYSEFASRIGLYSGMISLVLFGQLPKVVVIKGVRIRFEVIIICFVIIYWAYSYIICGFHSTYPYRFM